MKKTILLMLAVASALSGCVVVPARPAYYRPAPAYYYPAPHYYYHGY
ncbi:hypothetical protein WJ972_08250 [Achromobacter insuavis]